MKMKLERAVSAAQIAARLNSVRMKSSATARKLYSLKKLLEPAFEFYAQEEKKRIEELGGAIQEDGTILFQADQEAGLKKLREERAKLLDDEWEVPIDTPIIFRDAEGVQVSGNDIEVLDGLADFKE